MSRNAQHLLKTLQSMADNDRYLTPSQVQDVEALNELKALGQVTIDSRGPGWLLEVFPK